MASRKNLIREGIPDSNIYVTGNTVVDSIFWIAQKLDEDKSKRDSLLSEFTFLYSGKKLILVTGHRRESVGVGLIEFVALSELSQIKIQTLRYYIQCI